jgi:hypothetical protein
VISVFANTNIIAIISATHHIFIAMVVAMTAVAVVVVAIADAAIADII